MAVADHFCLQGVARPDASLTCMVRLGELPSILFNFFRRERCVGIGDTYDHYERQQDIMNILLGVVPVDRSQ